MRRSDSIVITAVAAMGMGGLCHAQIGGPVQAGDIVYGLSQANADLTMRLVRDCDDFGLWNEQAFLQSVAFDNANGLRSNARGNLLALNFGTISGGGVLYALATDGTSTTQVLHEFASPVTRVGGVSASPDNTRLAVWAVDPGGVIVLDYDAGPAVGSGTGATAVPVISIPGLAPTGTTQGTEWLDAQTLLAYVRTDDPADRLTQIIQIDLSGGAPVVSTALTIPVEEPTNGSQFLSIAHNPVVSPYIFCMWSRFSNGVSINQLAVVDPDGWQLLGRYDYSATIDTAREIALGPDGMLYVGAYGGSDAPGPWLNVIDVNDVGALVGNDSVQCWQAFDGGPIVSNFNGLAVAVEEPVNAPGILGDLNDDGVVDLADLLILLGGWGECGDPSDCPADLNGDGVVDLADLLAMLGNWG